MRLELKPASGVGPGFPAVSALKRLDTSVNGSSCCPSLKGFAQPAIVRDIQNGVQGRPAQVGVNHQYPTRVRFAERKGEVDDRQRLPLVRQRAGDHHGLELVLDLRLVQHAPSLRYCSSDTALDVAVTSRA